MTRKFWCSLTAVVLGTLLLALTGCLPGQRGNRTPPAAAAAILQGMCETRADADPHSVATYLRSSSPDGGNYLSDTLFSALYGEAARGLLSGTADTPAAINDAAICLSVAPTPVELAVFRCSDERGLATAVGLCQSRLDTVRAAWVGTEWETLTESGCVAVEGSCVLLVILPNPDRAVDAARRIIRRGDIRSA